MFRSPVRRPAQPLTGLLILLALLPARPAPALAAGSPMLVVTAESKGKNSKNGSVCFLDPTTYEMLGAVEIGQSPAPGELSPDERLLCVPSKARKGAAVPQGAPKLPGLVTAVDVAARSTRWEVPLRDVPSSLEFTGDSAALLCRVPHKGDEAESFVLVDLGTGGVVHETPVPRGLVTYFHFPQGRRFYLLLEPADKKKSPALEERVMDPTTGEVGPFPDSLDASFPLRRVYYEVFTYIRSFWQAVDQAERPAVRGPGGAFSYRLVGGDPEAKGGKDRPATIYVLRDSSQTVVDSISVGWRPTGLETDPATGRVIVCSQDTPKGKPGTLRAIRGREVVAQAPVSDAGPYNLVRASGDTMIVIAAKSLSKVDLAAGREIQRVDVGFSAGQVLLDTLATRAYVSDAYGSDVAALDLTSGLKLASVGTGRGGVKFMKFMGAALANAAMFAGSMYQAHTMAVQNAQIASLAGGGGPAVGYGWAPYYIATVNPGRTQMHMRDDGAFLYVLNTQTNDVTVIDTKSLKSTAMVSAGGGCCSLMPSSKGKVLFVLRETAVTVFSTQSNQVARMIQIPIKKIVGGYTSYGTPGVDPARQRMLILYPKGLMALSLDDGSAVGSPPFLPRPQQILFLSEPTGAPSAGTP
jgi:YVTN family beta-propeller protein